MVRTNDKVGACVCNNDRSSEEASSAWHNTLRRWTDRKATLDSN